jgi:hypothetical protein
MGKCGLRQAIDCQRHVLEALCDYRIEKSATEAEVKNEVKPYAPCWMMVAHLLELASKCDHAIALLRKAVTGSIPDSGQDVPFPAECLASLRGASTSRRSSALVFG